MQNNLVRVHDDRKRKYVSNVLMTKIRLHLAFIVHNNFMNLCDTFIFLLLALFLKY
jgi:hypothetical protein